VLLTTRVGFKHCNLTMARWPSKNKAPEDPDAEFALPSVLTLIGVGAKMSPEQFLRLNPHLPQDLTVAQLRKLNPKLLKSGSTPAYDDDGNDDDDGEPYDENDTTGLELLHKGNRKDNSEGNKVINAKSPQSVNTSFQGLDSNIFDKGVHDGRSPSDKSSTRSTKKPTAKGKKKAATTTKRGGRRSKPLLESVNDEPASGIGSHNNPRGEKKTLVVKLQLGNAALSTIRTTEMTAEPGLKVSIKVPDVVKGEDEAVESPTNIKVRIRVKSRQASENEESDAEAPTMKTTMKRGGQRSMKTLQAETEDEEEADSDNMPLAIKNSQKRTDQKLKVVLKMATQNGDEPGHEFVPTKTTKSHYRRVHQTRQSTTSQANTRPIVCSNCSITSTAQWRHLDDGTTLCNRCGLWSMKHQGEMRPLDRPDIVRNTRKRKSVVDESESSGGKQAKKPKLSDEAVASDEDQPGEVGKKRRVHRGINQDIVQIGEQESAPSKASEDGTVPISGRKRMSDRMEGYRMEKRRKVGEKWTTPTRSSARTDIETGED
jgi:hypothetical protein